MKWLLLVSGLSLVLGSGWIEIRKRQRRRTHVSPGWVKERLQLEREAFESVSVQFPIRKVVNESPHFQTRKLRRQA